MDDLLLKSVITELPLLINYIPNFISEEEEKDILQKVYLAPAVKWTQLSNRRLQNWGGVPHPKGMIAEEIPKWLERHMDKVTLLNVFEDKRPNHVLINEYLPGQGIMAHSDGPLFSPIVTTISCGSHTVLEFYKHRSTESSELQKREFSLLLEPRSLLILRKDVYQDYLHSISERDLDEISKDDIKNINYCENRNNNYTLKRSTRVSLTIRHVPKTSKFKLKFGK